jgi:sugar phosphate isomerase/epimerase
MEDGMSSAPFGVSQFTTFPQSFEEDLALYQKAGVEFIEVCESKLDPAKADRQLQQLQETGLRVASVQPRLHSLFPDEPRPQPASPHERMLELRKTMQRFGPLFPGTTLVSITGAVPKGDYALGYRVAAHEYREAAKAAVDHGVRLAVEPLNPILMNVDTFICSITHAARIFESVDHPNFGLFLDVWHFWEQTDAPALIQKYGPKIFGVHINDWHSPRAFGDRALPGDGIIPLVPLLKAIRATGYSGAYTLEIFSDTSLPGSLWLDPAQTVIKGKKAFEEIWEKVCA